MKLISLPEWGPDTSTIFVISLCRYFEKCSVPSSLSKNRLRELSKLVEVKGHRSGKELSFLLNTLERFRCCSVRLQQPLLTSAMQWWRKAVSSFQRRDFEDEGVKKDEVNLFPE